MMMDLAVTCSVDIQMCVWMHDYLYIIIYTHMHTEGGCYSVSRVLYLSSATIQRKLLSFCIPEANKNQLSSVI